MGWAGLRLHNTRLHSTGPLGLGWPIGRDLRVAGLPGSAGLRRREDSLATRAGPSGVTKGAGGIDDKRLRRSDARGLTEITHPPISQRRMVVGLLHTTTSSSGALSAAGCGRSGTGRRPEVVYTAAQKLGSLSPSLCMISLQEKGA